jgi:hypothetical protein
MSRPVRVRWAAAGASKGQTTVCPFYRPIVALRFGSGGYGLPAIGDNAIRSCSQKTLNIHAVLNGG